jgi:hypothetical protein
MSWLEQVAPTIATALGGPLAGLAVTAIAKVIGVDEKDVQNTIDSGKMSADQIAQIKLAEIEFQKQAQELGLNFEKLATDDRKSSREMQIATKSWVPSVLSMLVTVGFFGILIWLMVHPADTANTPLMIMLGSLGTAWTGIIAFYFGSSAGNSRKDEMLFNSVPANVK